MLCRLSSSPVHNVQTYLRPVIPKFCVEDPWVWVQKCLLHLGHMTKIAATPIYFMKPTRVDNQSVISATATALFTATAATDKLKTSLAAMLITSTAATLTRANVASLTSVTWLINVTAATSATAASLTIIKRLIHVTATAATLATSA